MSWTLCTSGAAISKAGSHANSTLIAYAGTNATILDKWSDEAEGRVCAECRSDFVTNIANYDTIIKNAISDAVSSLIASYIITYDSTGYLAREADLLMNYNDERYNKALVILKDDKNQRFNK